MLAVTCSAPTCGMMSSLRFLREKCCWAGAGYATSPKPTPRHPRPRGLPHAPLPTHHDICWLNWGSDALGHPDKANGFGWDPEDAPLHTPGNRHPRAPLCQDLPVWQLVPRLVARAGSPLAAHVEQEDVEAGAALLHALQHTLHAQAVG